MTIKYNQTLKCFEAKQHLAKLWLSKCFDPNMFISLCSYTEYIVFQFMGFTYIIMNF